MCDGGQGEGCCWIQGGTGVKRPAGSPCPPALSCQGGLLPKTHTGKVKVQHSLLQALSTTFKSRLRAEACRGICAFC